MDLAMSEELWEFGLEWRKETFGEVLPDDIREDVLEHLEEYGFDYQTYKLLSLPAEKLIELARPKTPSPVLHSTDFECPDPKNFKFKFPIGYFD